MFRFYQQPHETLLNKVRRRDWQKSLQNISDADILSINPNPFDDNKNENGETRVSEIENKQTDDNIKDSNDGGQKGTENKV